MAPTSLVSFEKHGARRVRRRHTRRRSPADTSFASQTRNQYNHEDDTRNGSTGFGFGTLLITADPSSGAPTGYGWAGRYSGDWVIPTTLAIGRPTD